MSEMTFSMKDNRGLEREIKLAFEKELENKLKECVQNALIRTAEKFKDDCLVDYDAFAQFYEMDNNVTFDMMWEGDDTIAIYIAEHMFMEYGTGITYQEPYPEPTEYGAGTWSDSAWGKGHWDDPSGWYDGMGRHHMGCPPAMTIFTHKQEIIDNFKTYLSEEIANFKGVSL